MIVLVVLLHGTYFGGPVVPLVKMTTAGAFSSRYRSEDTLISYGDSIGVMIEGATGMLRNDAAGFFCLTSLSSSPPIVEDADDVTTATDRDLTA